MFIISVTVFLIKLAGCEASFFGTIADGLYSFANLEMDMVFTNTCYEDIGCFYNGPPFFHIWNRPVSLVPVEAKDVGFYLYTPSNPQQSYNLTHTVESLKGSPFNPRLPTKVLLHGFDADEESIEKFLKMKNELLKHGDYNVILADYRQHVSLPVYQAAANTRTVGARIGLLLLFISEQTGADLDSFHLIGFSFGAHVAGYAAKRIKQQSKLVGRITGLDAAAMFFRDMDPDVRLVAEDAAFVDAIHTDTSAYFTSGGVGFEIPIAAADFYPNGGNWQPQCVKASTVPLIGGAIDYFARIANGHCFHGSAKDYFIESINSKDCRFLAAECESYQDFLDDRCLGIWSSSLNEMGFHAKRPRPGANKYYLVTAEQSPFCLKDGYRRR